MVDPSPHPGLRVYPECGVVPAGGTTPLNLLLCPEAVGGIDSQVGVALREGKSLSVRLAGMVEQPALSVDEVRVLLYSVGIMAFLISSGAVPIWECFLWCYSNPDLHYQQQGLPRYVCVLKFTTPILTQGSTSAELTFDLSHLSDFFLDLPNTQDAYSKNVSCTIIHTHML